MTDTIDPVLILQGISRFALEMDVIKEIEAILKPHFPSLILNVETTRNLMDKNFVAFHWQWMNHAIYDSELTTHNDVTSKELMEAKPQVCLRVHQAGKTSFHIDITEELQSNDPYWCCAQKLRECLEIRKQDIVEDITNKAIFGKGANPS
jgi:hypothetical protein